MTTTGPESPQSDVNLCMKPGSFGTSQIERLVTDEIRR